MSLPTPTLDPALLYNLIQHHPEHCLLYCQPCAAVLFPKGLHRHLQKLHKQVPAAQRQLLTQHCQSLELITQPKDLQLPLDNSLPLSFMPIQQGYSCCQCRFLTCSESNIRKHINKDHGQSQGACTRSY
jgi:hypothetical protein